jgi:hypothetical protein
MTKPIQLHVGYVGITREGKRVEIIGYLPDYTPYPWESDLEAYTSDGLYMNNNTSHLDIIGPWVETPVEPPVDYNDGKWHRWAGGECPVHLESVVQAKYIGLDCIHDIASVAAGFIWDSVAAPIVAFRVTKEYVEPPKVPRDFWLQSVGNGLSDVKTEKPSDMYGYIHVREVLTDD